jgi:hypothetical protein
MNSPVVTLSPEFTGKKLEIGDLFKAHVFVEYRVGSPGDAWEIASEKGEAWLPAGSVTISTASVRALNSDGSTMKFELEGMIHQGGPVWIGPFVLRNQVTKDEVEVPPIMVVEEATAEGTKPAEEPPWVIGGSAFGSWDWLTITLILGLLLVLGALATRYGLKRLREHLTRNLTYTERALNAVANLQKYARSKKPLQLEEWKKFSFELAGILRKFSDENFQIDSRDMTDREFLQELQARPKVAPFLTLISGILATITEVRYGRKELDTSVVPGLLLDAKKFIESTSIEPKSAEDKN